MQSLTADFAYEWEPFLVEGKHLNFDDHRKTRLSRGKCSHWDAAVYKWEGVLTAGQHSGEVGVLIGETGDLRQRIKQYVSGTQQSGNHYWREEYLTKGDIRLFVLSFPRLRVAEPPEEWETFGMENLGSDNLRLVLEQLLVLGESARRSEGRWIVNRRL